MKKLKTFLVEIEKVLNCHFCKKNKKILPKNAIFPVERIKNIDNLTTYCKKMSLNILEFFQQIFKIIHI